MIPLRITKLEPTLLPLVQKLYKQHYKSAKPKRDEEIIVAYDKLVMCGVVRLRTIETYQLLTGMLVIPDYRQKQIAHQIMNYCKDNHLNDNVFCFAYSHLEHFYSAHGFSTLDVNELPPSLRKRLDRYLSGRKPLVPMRYQSHD
jgi:N-acetylglutamate synthase-like GNAT family acetyltransferase